MSHSDNTSQTHGGESSESLEALLESSGAVLKGHFKLTSGRHSDTYFEKFRILEHPQLLSRLCSQIAEHFRGMNIDLVAGPTTGGIIIAFETARHLGVESRYIESENGVKQFRRNASLPLGANVLIVDDVLTTGLSLDESAEAVVAVGAKPVGFGVLIDRSETFQPSLPLYASVKVTAESYPADAIPEWLASIPVTKPGTRH